MSADSSRQFIDGIVAGMQTATSNRMTEIATVLTIVSTIILPLTLITGVYGMNFEIPELHLRNGYYICLSSMVLVVAAELWVFRRLSWLHSLIHALPRLFRRAAQPKPEPTEPILDDADYVVVGRSLPARAPRMS